MSKYYPLWIKLNNKKGRGDQTKTAVDTIKHTNIYINAVHETEKGGKGQKKAKNFPNWCTFIYISKKITKYQDYNTKKDKLKKIHI